MRQGSKNGRYDMGLGVLSAIGNTPLVQLERVLDGMDFRLYAKLESLNPGGSSKDRSAFSIITEALRCGELKQDSVIVESSSGNMAIGLAQACCFYGLRLICVVDSKATKQNLRLLQAYGAEMEIVDRPDPASGQLLPARLKRVEELRNAIPGAFWTNQYANINNANAHHRTMQEIVTALDGEVHVVFCPTGTCGTLRGCAEYIQQRNLAVKLVGVDAVGSVIFGRERGNRLIPGHGSAIRPELFHDGLADDHVCVTDLQCVIGCRLLARREASVAGGSSGGGILVRTG